MRVLVLAPQPFFEERGTPIATRRVVERLCGAGHDVDLLTYPQGQDVAISGCRHFRLSGRSRTARAMARTLRVSEIARVPAGFSVAKLRLDAVMIAEAIALAGASDYHWVHAVEEAVFIAAILERRFGVPYVYDMDSSLPAQLVEARPWLRPFRALLNACERRAIRGSLGVLAVCRETERVARSACEGSAPSGLPLVERIEDASLLGTLGAADAGGPPLLPTEVGERLVLYVGSLEPNQGVDMLLEAFARLPDAHGAELVVVGGNPPSVGALRAQAERLGVAETVHVVGPRPIARLRELLARATVVVSPRRRGANTPMKIYSYMDSERPIVATRVPGHTQVLDESCATLVEVEADDLARGLSEVLEDPEAARARAALARARLHERFDSTEQDARFDRFVREIADRAAAAAVVRGRG